MSPSRIQDVDLAVARGSKDPRVRSLAEAAVEQSHELARLRAKLASLEAPGYHGQVASADEAPDDSDVNKWIDEAESFPEALFEISDKYRVPVTNNERRWQGGEFIYEYGEFFDDIVDAVKRFPKFFEK